MVTIYHKFNTLESEKRERIINAAIKEFARNGYEKASTNEIIRKAEISKGSLFNYFNSKKELYLFLLGYIVEFIDKIYDQIDLNETDIFKRLREIGLTKFQIMKEFPHAFNFLKSVAKEEASEVKSEVDKIGKDILEIGFARIYENIDFSKFHDGIDIQKTINIINWTMIGFAEQQSNKLNSYEDINMGPLKEWEDYSGIMKRCFYKKEED